LRRPGHHHPLNAPRPALQDLECAPPRRTDGLTTLPRLDADPTLEGRAMPRSRPAIDSELAAALQAMPIGPNGIFDLTDIPATRQAVRALAESVAGTVPDEPTVATHEIQVPRAEGPDVPILLLRPRNPTGPLPVLLWFHGGGQVLGFAAQDAPWLKPLSAALGCAIALVDYRLAPETPAPGAAEDGYTAYRWISDNAADLGLDPARVGLAGQSGGGGI